LSGEALPAEPAAPAERPRRRLRRAVTGAVLGLLVLLATGLAIGAWVFIPFRISISSMEPTLLAARPGVTGDTILVDRLAYRGSGPARWDVVVFRPVEPEEAKKGVRIVKRVVGLPGETIEIEDGQVLVNGKPLEKPPELSGLRYVRSGPFALGPVELSKEEYFVLGDNSYPSVDSRRFGPLPRSNIIGQASYIVFPLRRLGRIR